ncbi:hypothetical protein [Plantactinospora sp. WMMB782]|uniref:hypothetical protein n=1 Tax=Plantactinospora sp. WMMB782 TaxID=3404121 RepID=UPI003B95D2A9
MNRDELIAGRALARVEFDADYNESSTPEAEFVADVEKANLITSMVSGRMHKPVIDLDLPARLVPSSTEGHFHLYIDQAVPWEAYVKLLEALADAGLVEPGYVRSSIARGFSAVRPPWVRK